MHLKGSTLIKIFCLWEVLVCCEVCCLYLSKLLCDQLLQFPVWHTEQPSKAQQIRCCISSSWGPEVLLCSPQLCFWCSFHIWDIQVWPSLEIETYSYLLHLPRSRSLSYKCLCINFIVLLWQKKMWIKATWGELILVHSSRVNYTNNQLRFWQSPCFSPKL